MKKQLCGYCKAEVKEGAKKCKTCGREFNYWKINSIKNFLKYIIFNLSLFMGGVFLTLLPDDIVIIYLIFFIILLCFNYYKRKSWFKLYRNPLLLFIGISSFILGYSLSKLFILNDLSKLYLGLISIGFILIFSSYIVINNIIKQRRMNLISNPEIFLAIGILCLFVFIFFLISFLFKRILTNNFIITISFLFVIIGFILIIYYKLKNES